jgi:hypothetical protein
MNKLFNLIIIFLLLAFIIPVVFKNIPGVAENINYYNILAGVSVFFVQFLYNLYMYYSKRRPDLNIKKNFMDALLTGIVVIIAYYGYEELYSYYAINIGLDPNVQRASIVTLMLLVFILLNSLVKP